MHKKYAIQLFVIWACATKILLSTFHKQELQKSQAWAQEANADVAEDLPERPCEQHCSPHRSVQFITFCSGAMGTAHRLPTRPAGQETGSGQIWVVCPSHSLSGDGRLVAHLPALVSSSMKGPEQSYRPEWDAALAVPNSWLIDVSAAAWPSLTSHCHSLASRLPALPAQLQENPGS